MLIYGLKEVGNDEIKYIGGTKRSLKERFNQHKHDWDKTNKLKTAWLERVNYNIEPVLIEDNIQTLEELIEKEIFYIKLFRSIGARLVNLTKGGDFPCGGTTWNKGIYKQDPVYQYDLDGNFIKEHASVHDAAISVGAFPTAINKACKLEMSKCNNFQWKKKSANLTTLPKYIDPLPKRRKEYMSEYWMTRRKIVLQLDLDGSIIREFNGITEVCEVLGLPKWAVNRSTLGQYKTPYKKKYIFIYKNDYDYTRTN